MNKSFKFSQGMAQISLLIMLLLMAIAVPVATKLVQDNADTRNLAREQNDESGGNYKKKSVVPKKKLEKESKKPTSIPIPKNVICGSSGCITKTPPCEHDYQCGWIDEAGFCNSKGKCQKGVQSPPTRTPNLPPEGGKCELDYQCGGPGKDGKTAFCNSKGKCQMMAGNMPKGGGRYCENDSECGPVNSGVFCNDNHECYKDQ